MSLPQDLPRVAVLLSVYLGDQFLPAQLGSIAQQRGVDWRILWRDDAPARPSHSMGRFIMDHGARIAPASLGPPEHLGVGASFLRLLASVPDDTEFAAFADQDDVWLPDKLRRACDQLAQLPLDIPAMACGRQTLVDKALLPIGLSPLPTRLLGFQNAVVQNVATGCTIVLNRAARRLLLDMPPPAGALHDWWCYLVVSGVGGRVVFDTEPNILYRQHGTNLVGAQRSLWRRAAAAAARGPRPFLQAMSNHLDALKQYGARLTPEARRTLWALEEAHGASPLRRLRALRDSGAYRQGRAEDATLRFWFALLPLPAARGE
ncbi:glycosyltransferase [Falsiroseomonas sp. E2-1-a20]|uniref:glycosyltransferase n=1 Tax=Falsiroseomonas sp. E2-1-a20 TaxID=3239300 RepID=UPI003F2C8DD2